MIELYKYECPVCDEKHVSDVENQSICPECMTEKPQQIVESFETELAEVMLDPEMREKWWE